MATESVHILDAKLLVLGLFSSTAKVSQFLEYQEPD